MTPNRFLPGPVLLMENEPVRRHGLLGYLNGIGLDVEIAGEPDEALKARGRRRNGSGVDGGQVRWRDEGGKA